MLDEEMFNRIYLVLFMEETRLENVVVERQNFIVRYRPSEPVPYIDLIKAQAEYDYFKKYVETLLDWLGHFVQ